MNITNIKKRLTSAPIPDATLAIYRDRLADILALHAATFSVARQIEDQQRQLAYDCYTQGLLDMAQITVPNNQINSADRQASRSDQRERC